MTPNPQNIGAAPEEYPIRAKLVRIAHWPYDGGPAVGETIMVREYRKNSEGEMLFQSANPDDPADDFLWLASELQIPPQEGEALPEAKPKGPSPSEVPQPGEGVDLEAIEARANAATPGPWYNEVAQDGEILPDGSGYAGDYYETDGINQRQPHEDREDRIGEIRLAADRKFVIEARTDIPALIAEVRRLRAALGKAGA